MQVAVIADTHLPRGNRRLPPRCIEQICAADAVIHAGDFTAEAAYDEIAALGPLLFAVHGNVDESLLRARLPATLAIESGGVKIAILHDAGPRRGRVQRLRAAFPEADCVIFGHSHAPEHIQVGGFQVFNPGSPTERRRAPTRSMGVAAIEAGRVRFRLVEL